METKDGILIVGVGGLGVPAALALARANIPSLGLIDPDPVDLSNLHRQVIYGGADIGTPKVEAATRRLRELNPALSVKAFHAEIDASNAGAIITRFAVVIDGTDNPAAKFLINDTCVASGRPFVYGGVLGMGGQVMTVIPGETACLRCVFEEPPDASEIATCREAGIIGPVAGLIGEIQAMEAIRLISDASPRLAGTVLSYDGAEAPRLRAISVSPRPGCLCRAYKEIRRSDAPARTH